VGALATGLFGAFYVKTTGANLQDPETIFIFLSTVLFHPLVGGFLLAAILAAVMSTISSQLLVTSSSLTGDFYHTFVRREASSAELVMVGRLSVVLVAAIAVFMAQDRNNTILTLVSHAWAGFGAAFGPVVVLSLFWRRMTKYGALAGIIAGAVTVLIWVYAPLGKGGQSLSDWMYEMVPGFTIGLLAIVGVSLLSPDPSKSITSKFDEVQTALSKV
jgi:Na+/proline symporter